MEITVVLYVRLEILTYVIYDATVGEDVHRSLSLSLVLVSSPFVTSGTSGRGSENERTSKQANERERAYDVTDVVYDDAEDDL